MPMARRVYGFLVGGELDWSRGSKALDFCNLLERFLSKPNSFILFLFTLHLLCKPIHSTDFFLFPLKTPSTTTCTWKKTLFWPISTTNGKITGLNILFTFSKTIGQWRTKHTNETCFLWIKCCSLLDLWTIFSFLENLLGSLFGSMSPLTIYSF